MKRQVIDFDDELQAGIERWRGKKNPIPPFKTAVQEILREAIKNASND